MQIKIKRISADAVLPQYAHGPLEDAGMDICSTAEVTLEPNVPVLVPTGLSVEIPSGYECQLRPRSGLALKQAITLPTHQRRSILVIGARYG